MIPQVSVELAEFSNNFSDADRRLAMPLMQVGRYLAAGIRARVTSGVGPDGAPWSDLSATGRWFWVAASERAGRGVIRMRNGKPLIPKAGAHAGMMAYESYAAYKRSRGGKDARNFVLSGQLMRSLRVKAMSPSRVRVAFVGGRGKDASGKRAPSNAQIAKWSNRTERVSILQPSRREIANAAKIVHRLVSAQWREQVAGAEIAFGARKVQRSVDRLTTRAGNVLTQLAGG